MAAPGSVKLNEDVLVVIDDNLIIVVSYDNLNWAFLVLGDRFRLDTWLNLTINKFLDEYSDIFLGKLLALVKGKFLILDGFLDGEGREFLGVEVEVAGVSAKRFGVNGGEVEFALMFDCQRLEGLG